MASSALVYMTFFGLLFMSASMALTPINGTEVPTFDTIPTTFRTTIPWTRYKPTGYIQVSGWFSEENSGLSLQAVRFIRGITCGEAECDKKKIWVVQANSNTKQLSAPVETTQWVSSDGSISSVLCFRGTVVSRIECDGTNCAKMRLHCSLYKGNFDVRTDDVAITWTGWLTSSTGTKSNKQCPNGSFLYGIKCQGTNCAEISLACAPVYYQSV